MKGPCDLCTYLGVDDDGNYPESANTWPVCDLPGQEHYSNLKSFPFKKDMPCFQKDIWHTEFADQLGEIFNERCNVEAGHPGRTPKEISDAEKEIWKNYRKKYVLGESL